MLIRSDVLPEVFPSDLPDEALVPGACQRPEGSPDPRGKLMPAAGERKGYSFTNFVHWASRVYIKNKGQHKIPGHFLFTLLIFILINKEND